MSDKRWQKVKEIFDEALRHKTEERIEYLERVCHDDKTLRREVESLLASYDNADGFMEKPCVEQSETVAAVSPQLTEGQTLGQYEIIRQIGAGGMGEVFLAKDKKLNRKVAVKILNEKFAAHKSNLTRFTQEAKAASGLNHPNILVIHEIGESENSHYIISEFVEGETLREILNQKTLKLTEVLEISIQIAHALVAAHTPHIVHRDIKPENIIVRPDGFVKILDFGLAKLVEQKAVGFEETTVKENETAKGIILGTINYMSPEQAKGERVDERTDIFSLGTVVFELIAGKTPFAGDSMSETFANLINAEPPPLSRFLPDVPDELQRIVSKSLRKNKDERYQTMKDLWIDLKSLHKRLEFDAELERSQSPNRITKEAQTPTLKFAVDVATQNLPPNNLPPNLSPIIGREKEIASIDNLLRREDVQLVTMIGVGGTGKTRLAQAVAERMLNEFAGGVFFIELAAITDPQFVASTIAFPLGVKEVGGKSFVEVLINYLREKKILLVIDNFEQVLPAAAHIAELLNSAPHLKILITSRELLHLSMEHEFIVPPLAVPSKNSAHSIDDLQKNEAVRLFVERAQTAKPKFALTVENAQSIAEICLRLEGLPLAIELAAARVKILSPPAMLSKLENRLKMLTGGARDLPLKQQTMRGAVEWSYNLLTEIEKLVFRALGVFAGGFTVEAVEAIIEYEEAEKLETPNAKPGIAKVRNTISKMEVLDVITSLADKSLIVADEQSDGETRFQMLEVIREYALESLEKCDEEKTVRRRHAEYFLTLGEEAESKMEGAEQLFWVTRLGQEHDNLRAALDWSHEFEPQIGLRLAAAIYYFWNIRGHHLEGRNWLDAALKKNIASPPSTRAKAFYGAGLLTFRGSDIETANLYFANGLEMAEAADDKRQIAFLNRGLGVICAAQGDNKTARSLYEKSIKIGKELNDKYLLATVLNDLGSIAIDEADYQTARGILEEVLNLSRQTGNQAYISISLGNLGEAAFFCGDYQTAHNCFIESLTFAQKLNYKNSIAESLDGFAGLAAKKGQLKRAAGLAGAAEKLREILGSKINPGTHPLYKYCTEKLHAALDEKTLAEFFEQGRKLELDEAIALALEDQTSETKKTQITAMGEKKVSQSNFAGTVSTKENLTPENDSPNSKLWYIVALLVFLLTGGIGYWFFSSRAANPKQIESIAVMPFVNESGNTDVEYLSDGMTETLIGSLSQLPNLNVKARSTVFRYKGKETNLQTIGKDLNVQAILTGRVVQRGDDLTLYLSLDDAAKENNIWSRQYNRKLSNLVALQTEIARDVANNLKTKLTGADEQKLAKNYTINPEAYQLYLKGRYHLLKTTLTGFQASIPYFRQAIDIDPNYALAYAGLADGYRSLALAGETFPNEAMPQAKAAATRALEIDDTLANAHSILGFIIFLYDWDWNAAENQFKRALELDPDNGDNHLFYSHMLSCAGRHAEAIAEARRARELDPLNLRTNALEIQLLTNAGQVDEALARAQKTLEIDPNYWLAYQFQASAYSEKGMYVEAIAAARKSLEMNFNSRTVSYLAYALAKFGKKAEARAELEKLLNLSKERYVPPYNVALIYYGLGEIDNTLIWLEKGYEVRDPRMTFIKVEPKFDELRNEPLFKDLMRRLNSP